jgi:hypothetical protein
MRDLTTDQKYAFVNAYCNQSRYAVTCVNAVSRPNLFPHSGGISYQLGPWWSGGDRSFGNGLCLTMAYRIKRYCCVHVIVGLRNQQAGGWTS